MGKKALRKDLWTEIRKSRNRFVSIFLIVALGVAFFSGVRAAQPDMRMTGDAYFDKYHLMDLRVVSTLGFSEENIEAIRNVEGVEMAEPSYMADVLHDTESSQMVLQFLADSDQTNETSVIEGRMPESFSQEAYTQVMIQVEGASELESHTDEYNDLVEQVERLIQGRNCTFSAFVVAAVRAAVEEVEGQHNPKEGEEP